MSVDPDSSTSVVYVKLCGEGTVVFRPVKAILLGPATARLTTPPDYDPDDEDWEFAPGSVVHVERRIINGNEACVAVALAM